MGGLEAAQQLVERVEHLLGERSLTSFWNLRLSSSRAARRCCARQAQQPLLGRAAGAARCEIGRPAVWTMSATRKSSQPELSPRGAEIRRSARPLKSRPAGTPVSRSSRSMRPWAEASSWPRAARRRGRSPRRARGLRTRSCQRRRAVGRLELAHGEVGAQRLAVVGERRPRARAGSGSRPCPRSPWARSSSRARTRRRRESRAGDGSGPSSASTVRSSTQLAQEALPLGVAPVEDRAGAHQRRRRDDKARRLDEAEPLEVREDLRGRAWPWRSVRLRPEVDEADRLDALCADLVEVADALRLALEVAVELLEARCARSACRLRAGGFSSSSKSSVSCSSSRSCLASSSRTRSRWRSRVSRRSCASRSPRSPELLDRERGQLLGARLELGQELRDVARRRVEQLALDRLGTAVASRRSPSDALEQLERLRLRVARVGLERPLALRSARPSAPRPARAPRAAARRRGRRARDGRAGPRAGSSRRPARGRRARGRGGRSPGSGSARAGAGRRAARGAGGRSSSVSTPASSKTTGRIGASRRQSASFWFCLRGARRVSSVAAQLGSAPARRSSGGKRPDLAASSSRGLARAVRRRGARASRRARRGTAPPRSRPTLASVSSRSGSARSAPSDPPGARARPRAPPR